jgi:uncharacterized Ntn-hydrolase superfamily protein
MKSGKTADTALSALLANDNRREYCQVAMLDAKGTVAIHIGQFCIPETGHMVGRGLEF